MHRIQLQHIAGICVVFSLTLQATAGDAAAEVDFNQNVRPILAQHCFKCHGFDPQARRGDLRLDRVDEVTASLPSGHTAVVAGNPHASELIRRVTAADPADRMPPADVAEPLSQQQIATLTAWIEQGAPWAEHWSLAAPQRVEPAAADRQRWSGQPIDRFVLAQLEAHDIEPSHEADRETLLRRVTLDLTGLPPAPGEIGTFLADDSPDAYERLVDRLLTSPHYGERTARRWLDLARYADSSGYANDNLRSMWPYRDWVVAAFNADLPFDEFTIQQLAGDLLPDPSQAQLVANGFHRNTPHQYEGGSDPEQYRVERVKNRVDTTGTIWLGMTVGCAQCHTHKFDPISHREYYQLYAFFNDSEEHDLSLPTPRQQDQLSRLDAEIARLSRRLEPLKQPHEEATENGGPTLDDAAEPPPEIARLEAELAFKQQQRKKLNGSLSTTLIVRERETPRDTFVQLRGDFLSTGEQVLPGTPACLPPLNGSTSARPDRLQLARWLVQPENPLTSRVTVNREWQHFFGTGLVKTENDFGFQGASPTHPRLLDWLAVEFVDDGYSFKRLHRLLVSTSTYRQSSRRRTDLEQIDPANELLARQSRHRVEGEIIRDLALTASGKLCRWIGGPGVFPPIEDNVIGTSSANHSWPASPAGDRFRRGLYTAIYRANVYPMLSTFDGPDRDNACTRRSRSNTPLQSLTLANSPAMDELFRGFAERVRADVPNDGHNERLAYAFRLCLGRRPNDVELERLSDFLVYHRDRFAANAPAAIRIAGSDYADDPETAADVAAWYAVGRLLMNLDEFVTRE